MSNILQSINIKTGNLKLGQDTAVINMGSAANCPSRELGTCQIVNTNLTCYAYKAERMYKSVRNYRQQQSTYWKINSASIIVSDIYEFTQKKRGIIKYLRFNEAGDFYDQNDIKKLSEIADSLNSRGIITYGYTARSDLDYHNVKFILRGSGFRGPHGQTIVIDKNSVIPLGYILCPMNCRYCISCKTISINNIAFRYH